MWRSPRFPRPGSRLAVLGYAIAWLVGAAAIAGLAVGLLHSSEPDEVSLPPVRETQLADAARDARCELVHAGTHGDRLNPAVDGPTATPAAPGVYEQPPSPAALVGAVRRGVVVIQVGRAVPDGTVELLADLQRAIPDGTIVTRASPGMPFAIAVTAYRRLLGCPRYTPKVLDAVRLFHGRFVGIGPDR
jgi:hypothetical protein